MTHVGYLVAGWAATLGTIIAYVMITVRRGRSLARQVPPEERRWS